MENFAQNQGGGGEREGGGGGGGGGVEMDSDSDSLSSRMERTFWTVLSYISAAVSRFLRAEPTIVSRTDPNTDQESPADGGPEVRPEEPLSKVSVIGSSRPDVGWESFASNTDIGPILDDGQKKSQLSQDGESRSSAEGQPTRDEGLHQSSRDAGDDKVEENGDLESGTQEAAGKPVSDEKTAPETLAGDATSEDVEKSGKKSSERLATEEDHENVDAETEISEDDGRELKEGDAEEGGVQTEEVSLQRVEADAEMKGAGAGGSHGVLQRASQNEGLLGRVSEGRRENQLFDGEESSQDDPQTACRRSPLTSYDGERVAVGSEYVTVHRSQSGEDEEERGALTEGEHVMQTVSGVGEEVEKKKSIPEDQEENISTGHDACSTVTHGEQQEVAGDTPAPTETDEADGAAPESHTDVTDTKYHESADNSLDEGSVDKDLVEEERLCKACDQEVARATSSVPEKPEGNSGEETNGFFENISPGMCEGRLAVSHGLGPPTHEETQKAVPEGNNERGPDKNTAQRFLEEPEYQETHAPPLPEEAGSGETENLQSWSCSAGADSSLVREHMEEGGERAEEIQSSSDVVVEDGAGERRPVDAGLTRETETRFIEAVEEEGDAVLFGIHASEEESETCVTVTEEAEELLMEPAVSEGLGEVRDDSQATGAAAAQEVVKVLEITQTQLPEITETCCFQNSVESDQKTFGSAGVQEGFAESGSPEPSVQTVTAVEQNVMKDVETVDFGFEEETEEDEVQNKSEMEILNQLVEADQPNTEGNEKERTAFRTAAEPEPLDPNNQVSGKEEPEAAEETERDRDLTMMSAEEVVTLVAGSEPVGPTFQRQDVIDEEILDPRMHPPPAGTDETKQHEGSEPGQEMDAELDQQCEEEPGILPMPREEAEEDEEEEEEAMEQLLESNSDADYSTLTAESGFSEQSLCDCAAEVELLANVSESTEGSERSTQQPNSDSEEVLVGESDETQQTPEEESSDASSLSEELNKLQEDEDGETGSEDEIGAEDTDSEDVEGAESSIELIAPFIDSTGQTENADLGPSVSGSEDISEERGTPTESESRDAACDESPSLGKPQPEEVVDSLPGLNRAEGEQLATRSDDQTEVDFALLDSTALRSRIAVKNPQVRPPTNPRALLHMPSAPHTPSAPPRPSSHLPVKIPAGLGFGVKLPELGAGFPALKRTQRVEPPTKSEEEDGAPRQDEVKPKRILPRHPGFGNPLMSELKSRLKKTPQSDNL